MTPNTYPERIRPSCTRFGNRIESALGFTRMQSRVAVMLTEGMSVPEIAKAFGRKESTIRTHVKNMFAKHGLSRHAELVRLVVQLANAPEARDSGREQS